MPRFTRASTSTSSSFNSSQSQKTADPSSRVEQWSSSNILKVSDNRKLRDEASDTLTKKKMKSCDTTGSSSNTGHRQHSKDRVHTGSDDSTITEQTVVRSRRRVTAVTDDTKQHHVQKKARFTSRSSERQHNLRSSVRLSTSEAEICVHTSQNSGKTVATVTPRIARQIDFGKLKPPSRGKGCESVNDLGEGVVNIYPQISCFNSCRCRRPAHLSRLVSIDENGAELSSIYLNQYGNENITQLKIQEDREHIIRLSMLPLKVSTLPSVSSISSTTLTSTPVDCESDEDQESSDETNANDSNGSGDSSSSMRSPRPGAHNRQGLRGVSTPMLLHFSTMPESESIPRQPYITPKMRSTLVNWLCEVAMEYQVSDEAFHLGISILDAVLANGPITPINTTRDDYDSDGYGYDSDKENKNPKYFLVLRTEFQALGCACLWIASKLQDKSPPVAEDFVYIADSCFSENELRKLEERVCKILDFRLFRVSPFHYINHFLKASYACNSGKFCPFDNPVLRLLTMYILELSRLSFELAVQKPSLVAAAAIFIARATLGIREANPKYQSDANGVWTKTLAYYTGYCVSDLSDAILLIHRYHLAAESSETLNASFSKFKKSQYRFVSLKTVPCVQTLGLDC